MKRMAFLLLTTLLIVSCSNDRDDNFDTLLEGQWVLTDVLCFCGFGENPDFSGHKITFEGSDLDVENSGEFSFLTDASGSYTLESNLITLTNGAQFTYEIEGNTLRLSFLDNPDLADDEVVYVYLRN